ncbi:MAG: hypothetical protein ACP5R3_06910, partial [Thermoplasmata archaeon]
INHRDEILRKNREYYINNRNRIIELVKREKKNRMNDDNLGSSGSEAIYKAKSIEELKNAIDKEKRRILKSSKKYENDKDIHYNIAYSDDYSDYVYFDNVNDIN